MAYHLHRQIREAAAATLTGLATSGANVYANRLYSIPQANLPALRISLDDESVEIQTVHSPHVQSRALTLSVECCAIAGDTVDDTCDQMAKEVEIALAAGLSVAGRTLTPLLAATRYDDQAGGYDQAIKRLDYRLEFETLNNAPDALT